MKIIKEILGRLFAVWGLTFVCDYYVHFSNSIFIVQLFSI